MITKIKNQNSLQIDVCAAGIKYTATINKNDFNCIEDICIEACTQMIEKNFNNKKMKLTPLMEMSIVSDNTEKLIVINTYKILINAAKHDKAEFLRKKFKKEFGVDLNDEPIRSK